MKKTVFVVLAVVVLVAGVACDDADTKPTDEPLFAPDEIVTATIGPSAVVVKKAEPPKKPHPHAACTDCGVVYRRSRLKKIEVFHFSHWDYLGIKPLSSTVNGRGRGIKIYASARRVQPSETKLISLCPDCHESLWQSLQPEEPCEKDTIQHLKGVVTIHSPDDPDGIVSDRIGW